MPKRYPKYGLYPLPCDYVVVWTTMMENECFMIIIYAFLFALGLKDYCMNIQDLSNLYNKKVQYDHHAENYKHSIIEDESHYASNQ